MESKRIRVGFITQWFDPETGAAAIPGVIARALATDMDVEVLTGFPNYPQGRLYDGYRLKMYQRDNAGDIVIHRVPVAPSHNDNWLRRALTWASFAASAALAAPVVLKNCDVVLVHMTPATVAIPALFLRIMRGTPYVLHIEDLWPDTLLAAKQTPLRGRKIFTKVLQALCDSLYRHASSIAVIAPGMINKIEERGVTRNRLDFVPNWADEKVFTPHRRDEGLKERLGLTAPFNLMYAGNLGQFQQLDTMIQAADHLRDDPQIGFVFVGSGVAEDRLRRAAADLSLSNVHFLPSQPMSAMGPIMALGDLHYVALTPDPLFELTIPSKIQGTMASGRAIVAGLSGDAARIVQDSGSGAVVPSGDSAALAAKVQEFARNREATVEAGLNGRRYYKKRLSERLGREALQRLLCKAVVGR